MTINLTFTESAKDKIVIARHENGKICFQDPKSIKKVKAGETWECEILKDDPKYMNVKPLKKLVTKEENDRTMKEMLLELKNQYQC